MSDAKQNFEVFCQKIILSFVDIDKWFEREDIPKALSVLNYASLAFVILWPFLLVGFILFYDSPGAKPLSGFQIFSIFTYPLALFVTSNISLWIKRRNKFLAYVIPVLSIVAVSWFIYSLFTLNG